MDRATYCSSTTTTYRKTQRKNVCACLLIDRARTCWLRCDLKYGIIVCRPTEHSQSLGRFRGVQQSCAVRGMGVCARRLPFCTTTVVVAPCTSKKLCTPVPLWSGHTYKSTTNIYHNHRAATSEMLSIAFVGILQLLVNIENDSKRFEHLRRLPQDFGEHVYYYWYCCTVLLCLESGVPHPRGVRASVEPP